MSEEGSFGLRKAEALPFLHRVNVAWFLSQEN